MRESGAKYVLTIFADFKGVLNNVLWDSVLSSMLGCREFRLWRRYFESRKVCVEGASCMGRRMWRVVVHRVHIYET